ncbi:protease complex subunit PrcB family protein [Fulvivirgaceae bacterium BMA12]|uniref:Protease complex subunit PrcB family protein n=1 Tax=Agaribacillus aureus TaxID=3051825 RepID=A0ABT8LAZ1_9BACT|nr:protease complex subunit PrcB family protein [Fulvivirgaceae bacterium BMA12]
MKKALVINFLMLMVFSGCSKDDNDLNKSVTFQTIEKNLYSGILDEQYVLVDDPNSWEDLWDKTAVWTPDELPEVDFTKSMVIAVYMGEKVSGGFEIEISELRESEDTIEVVSKITIPESGQGVTTALSQPFHIIKINKTSKKIIFSTVQYQ